jgi:protein ImuB
MQTREDEGRPAPAPGRRILCLWFPFLPLDRLARDEVAAGAATARGPRVVFAQEGRTARLVAVDGRAQAAGLSPGMTLADARAIEPALDAVARDSEADRRFLLRIARWAGSRAPHVALDGEDGLLLDVTGVAHLFGGEEGLRGSTMRSLARAGVVARAAIAPGAAAARAMCRFHAAAARAHGSAAILAAGTEAEALAGLPPVALGLPAATTGLLDRLGIARIGDLARLPRDGLAARFGGELLARLDAALDRRPEPISPLEPEPDWRARRAFAEPISTPEDLARLAAELAQALCNRLSRASRGARRFELRCRRIDGRVEACAVALAVPAHDGARVARLLAARVERIDPGLGVEGGELVATGVEALRPGQRLLAGTGGDAARADLAPLVDALANRLGGGAVARLALADRHLPEVAQRIAPVLGEPGAPGDAAATPAPGTRAWRSPWTDAATRPPLLLEAPEAVEATSVLPDGPPLQFRWRGRLRRARRADGPERIAPEWWRSEMRGHAARARDYYRVEDEDGARLWMFRDAGDGAGGDDGAGRWFVHGIFA